MWTRADLKRNAKIAFKRNWMVCAFACVITALLGGETFGGVTLQLRSNTSEGTATSYRSRIEQIMRGVSAEEMEMLATMAFAFLLAFVITFIVALAVQIFVGNVITVGSRRFFMENREHRTEMNQLFWAFSGGRYQNVVRVMLVRMIKTFLWSLLFIIPGIIKSYEYMMVPYLLADNPQLDNKRAFELSRAMMDGHKWEAFVLGLSFTGWVLLGGFLMGIPNIVYTNPYMTATFAEYYAALKAEAMYKGVTNETELPGFRGPLPDIDVVL